MSLNRFLRYPALGEAMISFQVVLLVLSKV